MPTSTELVKKIIVSSLYMRRKLRDADIDLVEDNKEFNVSCKNRYLTISRVFGGFSVESRTDFDAKISGKRLKLLSKICGLIEDQPIVIHFDQYDNINTSVQL